MTAPNTKIELMEPLGDVSPIMSFLRCNPDGGIHHICYEVDDILAARNRLVGEGARAWDARPGSGRMEILFLSASQGFLRHTD